jgi:hypothetical protein
MNTFKVAAVLSLLAAGAATAQTTTQDLISDLQADGFTRVEVKRGPTQLKVEAIRGSEKIEMIVDRATGAVLKSEAEEVGAFENTREGVSIRDRNRDFARVERAGGDDEDDDHEGKGRGHEDDDDDHASDDDDHDDGDDDSDDDNGGDHDRGDDDGDHDSGGHDGGGDHGGEDGDSDSDD